MRRFFTERVPDVGEVVALSEEVSHHLLRVTGIAPGEAVELFDGDGGSCRARLERVENGVAHLLGTERIVTEARQTHVDLVIAQTRANTMDTVLRMATELGVRSIQVIQSERCVAKGDKRDRWIRIVQSAAAQSGRTRVPQVCSPKALVDVLSAVTGPRVVCAPGAVETPMRSSEITVLIGPEGGLSESELAQAEAHGWSRVGLGRTVLRADTAAVAAIALYGLAG